MASEYEEIANEVFGTPQENFQKSIYVASQRQPDKFAENVKLAKKLNVNPSVVTDNNIDEAKKIMEQSQFDYDALNSIAPKTVRWMSKPDNASLAKDDVESLKKIERSIHDRSISENVYKSIATGMARMNADISRIPDFLYSLGAYPVNKAIEVFELPYKPLSSDQLYENKVAKSFEEQSQQLAQQSDWMNIKIQDAINEGNGADISKYLAAQILSNSPHQALNLAMAYAGMPIPAAVFNTMTVGASSIGESQARGVDPNTATESALLKGVEESLFEQLGTMGLFKKWEGAIQKSLGSESFKEIMKNVGKSVAHSFLGEGFEEGSTSLAQDFTDYATGNNPTALEGIFARAAESFTVGAFSGAMMTAPSAALSAMHKNNQKNKAQNSKDFFLNLEKQAVESKLNTRMPEKMGEFINDSVAGTGAENVYIAPEALRTYFQSKKIDPVQAMTNLGILEKWNAAEKTGADIEIQTGVLIEKLAGTEHFSALSDDIKFNPNDESVNEVKENQKREKEEQDQLRAQMAEQAFQQDEDLKQKLNERAVLNRKTIRENITKQLTDTGLYTKEQAQDNAVLYERFFGTLEAEYGLDAMKMFQDFAPQIIEGTFEIPNIMKEGAGQDKSVLEKIKNIVSQSDEQKIEREIPLPSEPPKIEYWSDGKMKHEPDILNYIRSQVEQSEASKRGFVKDESTNETRSYATGSSFPDYFRDKGYKKEEVLKIIDKSKDMSKKLTDKQRAILDDLYEGAVREINDRMTKTPEELFQDEMRGSYTANKRLIKIAKSSNLSTFLHESGHYFLDVMEQISKSKEVPEKMKKDFQAILDYVGSTGELKTEHHEKFANAFENYLASGKAPSQALRKAFDTFKNWLFTVYNGIRMYPKLNPEITAVFDRMIASQKEIDAYQAELENSVFSDGSKIGLKGKRLERYNELIPEIKMEAQDQLIEKALEKENAKIRKEYKDQHAKVKSAFESLADTMPVFRVIDQIENDPDVGAIEIKDVEQYELKEDFPRRLMKKGGSSAEVLANIHGYESAYALLKDIVENRSRDEFVKSSTDAEMMRLFPELQPLVALSEEAAQAVRNDKKADLLKLQLDILAEKAFPLVKGMAKNLIKRVPTSKDVKLQAMNMLYQMKTSEIKPGNYMKAERKYAKIASDLFVKGDIEGAFEAKKKEYLNFELFRAAMAAQNQMRKDKNFFKRLQKSDEEISKKREMNYVNVARSILKMYGLGSSKKTMSDYLDALRKYDAESYESFSLLVEPVQDAAKPVAETTFLEYSKMRDLVSDLWDMGKIVKHFKVAGETYQAEEVANKLVPQFESITKEQGPKKYTKKQTEDEKKKTGLLAEKASYRRFESWVNGITTEGQKATLTDAFNFLFRPVSEADTKLRVKINETNDNLRKIVDRNKAWFHDDKVFVSDEINHVFHKDDILMTILHSGNESNFRKLVVGRGWGTIDENGILDSSKLDSAMARARKEGYITKETYQMAQEIWDLIDSLVPDTQKAFKEVRGYYFGNITKTPFKNEFGSFSGGYIPAKLDPSLMKDQAQKKTIENIIKQDDSYIYPSKQMDSGFAKDRKENYHGPLSLEFSLLGSHLDQVLKFTYMEPARKQMQILLKNDSLRAAINAFDENAMDEIIEPFLMRAKDQKIIIPANSTSAANRALQRFSTFLRNTATVQIMTGLTSSAMQQFTGLTVAKTKFMGDQKSHLSSALKDYFKSPSSAVEKAAELSDWFKAEMVNNNFEMHKQIEDIVLNKSDLQKAQEFAKKNAYFLQRAAQNVVSTVVWHAAYNQYYERTPNGSQRDAVQYADSMVRTTQGTNNPIDVSQGQVSTPLEALFTQFTGYFNMVYNLKKEQYERIERESGFKGNSKDPWDVRRRKFLVYATASAIPAIIVGQILRVMAGRPFDEDGDGIGLIDILSAIGLPLLAAEINMLPTNPLLKQSFNLALNKFNKYQGDDRMQSPGVAILEKASGAAADAYTAAFSEVNNRRTAVVDVLTLIGMATQLPVAPLAKPVNYILDIEEGKAEPTGPIDFTRGFITGAPGGEKN